MPRPNKERSVGAERRLAERIRIERDIRGWSTAQLAEELRGVGLAINQSAIWKIENSGRRITLDEAVAMSRLWNIPLDRLIAQAE